MATGAVKSTKTQTEPPLSDAELRSRWQQQDPKDRSFADNVAAQILGPDVTDEDYFYPMLNHAGHSEFYDVATRQYHTHYAESWTSSIGEGFMDKLDSYLIYGATLDCRNQSATFEKTVRSNIWQRDPDPETNQSETLYLNPAKGQTPLSSSYAGLELYNKYCGSGANTNK